MTKNGITLWSIHDRGLVMLESLLNDMEIGTDTTESPSILRLQSICSKSNPSQMVLDAMLWKRVRRCGLNEECKLAHGFIKNDLAGIMISIRALSR
jgi:hypothetical protein